jgi:6,7-dimethyl-8-ribityllumazine synthase
MSQWQEERKPFDADAPDVGVEDEPKGWTDPSPAEPAPAYAAEEALDSDEDVEPLGVVDEPEEEEEEAEEEADEAAPLEHVSSGLSIPDGYKVLEGEAVGERRSVAVVVSRFNGEITTELLRQALDELELHGVARTAITVVPVPGAFELPLAAMALAKTRRYACVVALGCIIRGETQHFEYVANEAASGLQLAALETGTPVSFGVLTCDTEEQARARLARGADAARSGLEMAEVFAQLRAAAAG